MLTRLTRQYCEKKQKKVHTLVRSLRARAGTGISASTKWLKKGKRTPCKSRAMQTQRNYCFRCTPFRTTNSLLSSEKCSAKMTREKIKGSVTRKTYRA